MRMYLRSRTWLALIVTVALFSTINVYFLSPYSITDVQKAHREEVVHSLEHPKKAMTGLQREDPNKPNGHPHYDGDASRVLRSGKTCPNLTISFPLEDSQSFQPIKGSDTFVYSAFLVGYRVRIIVLRKRVDPRMFFCHLWTNSNSSSSNNNNDNLFVVRGNVYTIPEDHDRPYIAAYIVCDLPPQLKSHHPFAVSIVLNDKCSIPSNRLPINLPKPKQYKFTVCVTALNKQFGNTHMFVEMIEFNRLLGADRFVFYNHSIHPDIGKILQHYGKLGLVDLRQWPSSLPQQAHYFGQLASLNDCLYRYKNRSRYIVFQDLDEFIVPKGVNQTNWSQLIESRLKINPNFAVFLAQCTFFRKEWPSPFKNFPRNDDVKKYRSVVLGHTLREGQILRHGHRSKYIINPDFVETVGIHDVWAKTGASRDSDQIDKNIALLYHYRDWENPNDTQQRFEDNFVVGKYGFPLIDRLAKAWDMIKSNTGIGW